MKKFIILKYESSTEPTVRIKYAESCKYFLRGKCRKGKSCEYQHKLSKEFNQFVNVYKFCENYLKSKCTYTNCKYLHDTSPEDFYKTGVLPEHVLADMAKRDRLIPLQAIPTVSLLSPSPPPSRPILTVSLLSPSPSPSPPIQTVSLLSPSPSPSPPIQTVSLLSPSPSPLPQPIQSLPPPPPPPQPILPLPPLPLHLMLSLPPPPPPPPPPPEVQPQVRRNWRPALNENSSRKRSHVNADLRKVINDMNKIVEILEIRMEQFEEKIDVLIKHHEIKKRTITEMDSEDEMLIQAWKIKRSRCALP